MSSAEGRTRSWLARTAGFQLHGPMDYERLCGMIRSGEVGREDEVCPANSYWFSLKEDGEVARWLGVEIPKPVRPKKSRSGSSTEVDDEETATSDIVVPPRSAAPVAEGFGAMGDAPESTRMLTRAPQPQSAQPGFTETPAPATRAQTEVSSPGFEEDEGPSFFKNFGWLLVAGAALLFYIVLRMGRLN